MPDMADTMVLRGRNDGTQEGPRSARRASLRTPISRVGRGCTERASSRGRVCHAVAQLTPASGPKRARRRLVPTPPEEVTRDPPSLLEIVGMLADPSLIEHVTPQVLVVEE